MSSNPRPTSPVKHSAPIPIGNSRYRGRSVSVSSSTSSGSSESTPPELATPVSPYNNLPVTASPGSSPILSYFRGLPPSKSPTTTATFPFRKFGSTAATPVFEEDESKTELPVTSHARRASTIAAGKFGAQPGSIPDQQLERGAGMLRRLSIGGANLNFVRPVPNAPPNSAVSPVDKTMPSPLRQGKSRRSTVSEAKTRRAPSPMGERILKGHFDGFN